jgi:WD40 repeat protein
MTIRQGRSRLAISFCGIGLVISCAWGGPMSDKRVTIVPDTPEANSGELVVSSDGKRLGFISRHLVVRWWEPKTGRPLASVDCGGGYSAIVLPFGHGKQFLMADGRSLVGRDAESGKRTATKVDSDEVIWSAAISPDGEYLAVSTRQSLGVRSLPSGRALYSFESVGRVLTFSPDGQLVVNGGPDGKIVVASLGEKKVTKSIHLPQPKENEVTALAVSNDGRFIVAGTRAGNVYVADLEGKKPLHHFSPRSTVCSVAFSSTSTLIAAGCIDESVYVWDRMTDRQKYELSDTGSPISTVRFADADRFVAGAGWDGSVHCWGADSGKLLWKAK